MAHFGALGDVMDEIHRYAHKDRGLAERISAGAAYLRGLDQGIFDLCVEGFRETERICGKDIYAVHQVYRPKPSARAKFETHRRYVDLQCVWSGSEDIYILSPSGLNPLGPYSRKDDIRFYGPSPGGDIRALLRKASRLRMEPGCLAVLFPVDAHAPAVFCGSAGPVAKTVVKVLLR
ncbi:MAG: DUF386 domain-containing protein [Elusimicrobia bacterium]|nr:DUF386 domain-containing protein [Elusimicrobiota bacterium]